MIYTKRTFQTLIRYEVSMKRTTTRWFLFYLPAARLLKRSTWLSWCPGAQWRPWPWLLVPALPPSHRRCWTANPLKDDDHEKWQRLRTQWLTFSAVTLLLHQVISASECDKVSLKTLEDIKVWLPSLSYEYWRSRPGPGWRQIWCTWRRCGTAGRSAAAARPPQTCRGKKEGLEEQQGPGSLHLLSSQRTW